MKVNVRLLCRTALLLALCVASQFLKNTSVYLTGPVINAILILATLSCGFFSGAVLAVLTPLTSWWITGSPVMSAYPAIVPAVMGGNLLLVVCVWFFALRLERKIPQTERLSFSDGRFRIVLVVAAVACALWSGITLAFLTAFSSAFQIDGISSVFLTALGLIVGAFLVFIALWALVARFPQTWSLIGGMVIGSVVKAVAMWVVIVRIILPEAAPEAVKMTFSVTQLITALLGSVVAFLVWMPLKKVLSGGKHESSGH